MGYKEMLQKESFKKSAGNPQEESIYFSLMPPVHYNSGTAGWMTSRPTEDYSALQGYSNDVSFTKEPTSDDTFLPNMKYKKNTHKFVLLGSLFSIVLVLGLCLALFLWPVEEDIQIGDADICCDRIRIFSTGAASRYYPFLMGNYDKVMLQFEGKMFLAYQKSDRSSLFVTKPTTDEFQFYNWGVSRSPLARWGYLRSSYGGRCPTRSGEWKVYQAERQTWRPDYSLTLSCL